jgi:hypothetical protein
MLQQLVAFVLYALVAGAVIGLLLYAVAIFVIIYMLLGLVGGAGGGMPHLHISQAAQHQLV